MKIQTGVPIFDSVVGGFLQPGTHLAYGEPGAGKSTFALQFLHWGLNRGESALLVTRRLGSDVMEQAEAFGVPLKTFIRSGKLTLLEYAPDVVERAARARDVSQIADELDYFARRRGVRRMVFDPLIPLIQGMNVSEKSFRIRTLVQRVSVYQAACLFVLDLPEAADIVASCKDVVQSVLRFQANPEQSGQGTLVIERMPGSTQGRSGISYSLVLGRGLVKSSPEEIAGSEKPKRKILVAATDPATLNVARQMLADEYELTYCGDAIQTLARMAADAPDLLIVDADLGGNNAVQACLELRRNQLNLPILLLLGHHRRLRDRLEFLARGIDDCLEKPVDGRLLRVRIRSLLKRYSPRERFRAQESDGAVLASLERPVPASQCLSDFEAFRACLQEEVSWSRQRSALFAVCILEMESNNGSGVEAVLEVVHRCIRSTDKVYANNGTVAVLFPDSRQEGVDAFCRRIKAETPVMASVHSRSYVLDGSEDFASRVLRGLLPKAGTGSGLQVGTEAT